MELVVVGYGNMAKAILCGLLRQSKETLGIKNIVIAGRSPQNIESWLTNIMQTYRSEFINDITYKTTYDIYCDNKIILLACKPYNLDSFLFHGNAKILYSVLAGINVNTLKNHIKSHNYVLIMPNIGANYGLSSTAVLWKQNGTSKTIKESGKVLDIMLDNDTQEVKDISTNIKKQIVNFISSFGNCEFVENEEELLASIATNGSAPALLSLVAQALINAGVKQGLKPDVSKRLVQKTFEGVAKLLEDKSPQEIKDLVTSPSGTTAEALLYCDENGVQGIITRALVKAVEKAKCSK